MQFSLVGVLVYLQALFRFSGSFGFSLVVPVMLFIRSCVPVALNTHSEITSFLLVASMFLYFLHSSLHVVH